MDESLEVFLTKIRRDLEPLTAEERESRLDAITEQLARDIANGIEQGLDEEAATRTAIQKAKYRLRSGTALSPTMVAVLYTAFFGKLIAIGFGYVFYWLANILSSKTHSAPTVFIPTDVNPSLVFAVIAGVLLLFHDGFSGVVSTVKARGSLPGIGVRWSALRQTLVNLLAILLILILGDSESPALIPVALSLAILIPGASYLAGWMTACSAPKLGLQAVTIAAVTGGTISLADKTFWVIANGTDSPFSFRVTLILFLVLVQALLAGLAIAGARIGSQEGITPR